MTLGVNPSSSIPESPKSCNSRFLNHLSTIGAAVVGLFLTSNPMRTDTSYATDLSSRAVVQRTEQVTTAVQPDEETDSDDDEMDVELASSDALLESEFAAIDSECEFFADEIGVDATLGVEDTRIDPKVLNHGLIYEIYNPATKTTSFLIGTFHVTALKNPYISNIVDHCARVYTEIGELYSSPRDKPITSLRFDDAIVKIALEGKKEVVALDKFTGVAERTIQCTKQAEKEGRTPSVMEETLHALIGPGESHQELLSEISKPGFDREFPLVYEAWQNGDAHYLTERREYLQAVYPTYYDKTFARREKIWLEKITHDLNVAKSPVCIAVGASHLAGREGLVTALQKKGFIVTKSTFSSSAR